LAWAAADNRQQSARTIGRAEEKQHQWPSSGDDLVTDLRSLRGTELERTVHDAIKVGIDDALTKNIAPVMVGYEAMAQGLAILTGADLDQSRDALLNVIKDLGAQLSAIQTVAPPRA
jgi:hypothetical protein